MGVRGHMQRGGQWGTCNAGGIVDSSGKLADIIFLPVTAPIAELVFQGQWCDLLGMGRWSCLFRALPEDIQEAMYAFGHADFNRTELSSSRAAYVAEQVREWAPVLRAHSADPEEACLALDGVVRWLDGLARNDGPQQLNIAKGSSYTVMQLLQALLLSRLVRDSRRLSDVIRYAFALVFPSLSSHVAETIGKHTSAGIPSCSTISRARLPLDATLLIIQTRSEVAAIRYGIADSSPQKGHDGLLSAVDEINAEDVVPCFRSAHALIAESHRRLAADLVDPEQSKHTHQVVFNGVRRVHAIPVALGSGATSLTHKVSALLFAWSCGRRREGLVESLRS